jgi:hypothetical protein
MFELVIDSKAPTGHLERKPDAPHATRTSVKTADNVVLDLTHAELDALTDIVLNAPPTKLVNDEMAEHLLRRLMQLQREKLFTSPE